jgi:hypothetical protein
MSRGGLRPPRMQFIELTSVPRATGEIFYKNVVGLLEKSEWPLEKLVALATDGATSMIWVRLGLAGRLRADVPTLIMCIVLHIGESFILRFFVFKYFFECNMFID